MKFLVHSTTTASSIKSGLGGVDYSYYFVLKSYLPLLEQLGDVEILEYPPETGSFNESELDENTFYLSFTPPNQVVTGSGVPTIPVFAWEFGTLPDEKFVFDNDSWKYVLEQVSGALTHSSFAVDVVKKSMGDDYPVASIPAPIWDSLEEIRVQREGGILALEDLDLRCTVVDSADFMVSAGQLTCDSATEGSKRFCVGRQWDGEPLEASFADPSTLPLHYGFAQSPSGELQLEGEHGWFVLAQFINESCVLDIELVAAGQDVGALVCIALGESRAVVRLAPGKQTHRLLFEPGRPANIVSLSLRSTTTTAKLHGLHVLRACIVRAQTNVADEASADLATNESPTWYGVDQAEPWGRWTTDTHSGVTLPHSVSGVVTVSFDIVNSLIPAGHVFRVELGHQSKEVILEGPQQTVELVFDCFESTDHIGLCELQTASPGGDDDRQLGIGFTNLRVNMQAENACSARDGASDDKRHTPGIVYSTVFNPVDGRKNWPAILDAFVFALRDQADAVLLVKIVHNQLQLFIDDLLSYLTDLAPFSCRIIFLHGYLEEPEYRSLIQASHFVVNASRGEGQCLPLMEYMSSGVPALAPDNTAMADYVSAQNSFVLRSSIEPWVWPQDPRLLFRTTRYRVNWESLFNAYRDSYELAVNRQDDYRQMSRAAVASLEKYCSLASAREALEDFLGHFSQ